MMLLMLLFTARQQDGILGKGFVVNVVRRRPTAAPNHRTRRPYKLFKGGLLG